MEILYEEIKQETKAIFGTSSFVKSFGDKDIKDRKDGYILSEDDDEFDDDESSILVNNKDLDSSIDYESQIPSKSKR